MVPESSSRQNLLETVFSFLSADEVATVSGYVAVTDVPAGQDLYVPGSAADSCYIVLEGCLAIKIPGGLGAKNQVVALLYPRAPVGERGIVEPAVRTITVTAVKNARVAELARTSFSALQVEHPQLAIKLLGYFLLKSSRRLEKCSERLSRIL